MSSVPDSSSATIAAVLLPGERPRVDAAGNGLFAVLHRDSIPDAVRAVRERPVDAVLVSVHRCGADQMEVLGHLVREFPSIPTVALVSQHDPGAIEMLLRLGASGVRQVVDVTSPSGWGRLRQVVGQPATRAVALLLPLVSLPLDAPIEGADQCSMELLQLTAMFSRDYGVPVDLKVVAR